LRFPVSPPFSDSISQRASLFTYHLVCPRYSLAPSSRNTPTIPEPPIQLRTIYVNSGSGSATRTDISADLATAPYPLTSSRTCHRHVTLIGECVQVGIFSTNDAADYYHQFLLITRFLISKNRLSTIDLLHNFMHGLCPDLAYHVMQRLLLHHLDHPPEDPYEMDKVYNMTTFIIGGPPQGVYGAVPPAQVYAPGPYQPPTYWALPTQPTYLAATQQAYPNPSLQAYPAATQPQNPYTPPMQQVPADPTNVKIEALMAMVNKFGKMLKTAIEIQQGGSKPRNVGLRPTSATRSLCNFCSGTSHFIKKCRVVTEYCRVSKCKHSAEGKVVLPSGMMVLHNVQGVWLHNRMDEWHRQNPRQTALQMILKVAVVQSVPAPVSVSACQSSTGYPTQQAGQYPEVSQTEAYTLRRVPAPWPDATGRLHPAHENTASAAPGSHGHSRAVAPTSLPRDLLLHLPQEGALLSKPAKKQACKK
jgi:hypothetical protein